MKSFCDAFNGEAHEFYLDKDAFLVGQAALAEVATRYLGHETVLWQFRGGSGKTLLPAAAIMACTSSSSCTLDTTLLAQIHRHILHYTVLNEQNFHCKFSRLCQKIAYTNMPPLLHVYLQVL